MAAMGWWEKSRIHQALKRLIAGPGIEVDSTTPSAPVVSAKISTDASNALSFGTDDGLYATSESPFANQLVIRKDFHGITAGDELYAYMPSPMSIGGVSILATPPGDLVVDVRRTPIGSFPATGGDSICAAAKPTLANAQTYLDTTLTGWSTGSIEGDTLTIHVDSVTTVTDFEITLYGQAVILPPVITGHLPDATIGDMASYSYTVTGGYGTTTVTIYSGALPAGASISTAGAVSGTYTTGGSYSWVLEVEDSLGSKAYLSDSNAIAYATLSSTGALTDADIGDPVGGSITLSGGDGTYTIDASPVSGTRPAGNGLALVGSVYSDSSGVLTTAATYTWTDRFRSGDGQTLDVPSSITVSAAVVYATWNPSDKHANITLSNGDMRATTTTDGGYSVRSTAAISGKRYFEFELLSDLGGEACAAGVATASEALTKFVGETTKSAGEWYPNNTIYANNSVVANQTDSSSGSVQRYKVCVDSATRKVWISREDLSYPLSGDPAAGTNPTYTLSGTDGIYACATPYENVNTYVDLVSNPSDMIGSPPSGFTAGL